MMGLAYINDEKSQLSFNGNIERTIVQHTTQSTYNDASTSLINPPDVIVSCHEHDTEKSLLERIIHCFSLQENIQSLTNTKASPGAVPVIDGFK